MAHRSLLNRKTASEEASSHTGDPDFMTSLARGLAVLLAFSQQRRTLSVAQISHATGLSRASVRRCLHTLTILGYTASDEYNHYRLKPKILSLGLAYISSSSLATQSRVILERLSAETKEACSVAIREGMEITYLARSSYVQRVMSIDLGVGSRLPCACTSMGRVLLAALPPETWETVLAELPLERFTQYTVTDRATLLAMLAKIRNDGYAFNDQELEIGLISIAVPLRDHQGQTIAAMNIATQSTRLTARDLENRFLGPLRSAAKDLEAILWI